MPLSIRLDPQGRSLPIFVCPYRDLRALTAMVKRAITRARRVLRTPTGSPKAMGMVGW